MNQPTDETGKMKVIEISSREYLSKDILDDDLIKTFKLFNRIQMVLGSARIHAKDRFVTSPTVYQKFYTIMIVILLIAWYILTDKMYFSRFRDYSSVYYLCAFGAGLNLAAFISNIIHVRFFNSVANTEFYNKLQSTDRLMKLDRIKVLNTTLYRINLFTITGLLTVVLVLAAASFTKGGLTFISFSGFVYSQLTFILEMTCCSNTVLYFFIRVRFVNSILYNHLNPAKTEQCANKYTRNVFTKKFMRCLVAESHDFTFSETDFYLKAIFDGFSKFQEVYRFQVFIFCVKLVLQSLITFEFVLYAIQRNLLQLIELIFLVTYSAIDFLTALFLSVRFERFFREVKETKRLCIDIMMQYQEGPLREKVRTMFKMIEESPPCFSVYEMWQMDASIFVKILSLVTSLTVTLLQFAFL